ncbi:peptidyl-prolyl cis trans isomerase [Stemphylium lycopersici]|uniref:peptidylprolyl isomerase n=1 Tax=Stemphylium lycopersici TaxID=183478 RepID=A0A364MVQ5_STELY|nr:peptidyl-prolyl cis trans isomerase [Stemphylium lycopersici]RAR05051.1 peptidyl-prolyl cis trans isomerase [Stemphylium lycopersici]
MSSADTGLPEGWEVRRSNTKNLPYYFHAQTKDSRWEPPAGTDPDKLKAFMAANHSSKGVAPAAQAPSEGKIRCAHLLVKHRDSRRPASWREPNITRSVEEARDMIQRYQEQIKAFEAGTNDANAKSLSELATTESDCSSARKGGDLGFFGQGDMQKEFEQAAFELQKGQVSEPVETASGVHLIQSYPASFTAHGARCPCNLPLPIGEAALSGIWETAGHLDSHPHTPNAARKLETSVVPYKYHSHSFDPSTAIVIAPRQRVKFAACSTFAGLAIDLLEYTSPPAMATPQSPNPIYHNPAQPRPASSRRMSVATLSRSASYLNAVRNATPKDGDAFSYDPAHLRHWYCPRELWDRLPDQVQSSLAAVQHAGAAVLTGFERLDKHLESSEDSDVDTKPTADDLLVQLDQLPPPRFRTISNASSVFQSDSSSPLTSVSSTSQSGSASPLTSSLPVSQVMCPGSPICLGPSELSRSRERSFSTPLKSHDAYYAAELSHLRTEALPRLRHKTYKVDTAWCEAKAHINPEDVNAFENWLAEKKCAILSLNERGKRLASAVGIANTGLGWCAP